MEFRLRGSRIVIVDDSNTILKKMRLFLADQGYQVYAASDGKEGLKLVYEIKPDLVILDFDMPYLNGLEVCKIIKENEATSLIPIIILTASAGQEVKNSALMVGANDFLSKSLDLFELKLKVESLIKLKHAVDQLENANNIIKSLAKTVEYKDKYTVGHAERVSTYAVQIGKILQLDDNQIKDITMAGLLHDIGKVGIPDIILNKPGKLDPEEFEIIKMHPVIGEEICAPIKSFDRVKTIIRHHHEKQDGKGYPDGLDGGQLGIEIKIMTVADIYDALTSNRAYRKGMTNKLAFELLTNMTTKGELDAQVVNALREAVIEWKD